MCCATVGGSACPPPGAPDAAVEHLDLDPVPASASLARRFVQDALAEVEPEVRETALLLASELVTNAVLHARTPVQIGITVDDRQAMVCVSDRSPHSGEVVPKPHSRTRPGGRGLALVADLAEQWGTATYSGGKTVWFLLSLVPNTVRV